MFKKVGLVVLIIICVVMLIVTVSAGGVNVTVEFEKMSVSEDVGSVNETLSSGEGDFTQLANDINNGGLSVKFSAFR